MTHICIRCLKDIKPGDDYVQDGLHHICADCIEDYIFDRYDIFDIARELGMKVGEVPEEPKPKKDEQLPGQMDMFGGIAGEND